MNEKFSEIRDLFLASLERDGLEAQLQYAAEHCAGHPELRRELEEMLRAHHQPGGFLASGGAATAVLESIVERPGVQIGPYKLLEQIGEGGMGTVFMAEQSHPVQRKVALKVIKPGMDNGQVIARFEAERQALALMDHPNIAKVLDAGTTSAGRPYFVMELVKGVPITTYCDENHLPPQARLELFTQVCHAVQHAHQKAVIHRDLKPSNVLVALYDDRPVPKVIDFGVAKATGGRLTERTMFTGFGQIVGTLEYMSPEQARLNALDIDTRGDIYSLGVLLYELLTGTTPFDKKRLREAAFDEMLRMIREEEPPKPSTRLSTAEGRASIAVNRGTEPAKLTRLVRGVLDWIVMKALEKDRNRRYETANGFAMDVQRYLADEAVLAGPPSAWYRFRKFARRNKRELATAALLGVVVMAAVASIGGTVGWAAQERSVRQAKLNAEVALALDEAGRARDRVLTQTHDPVQWEAALAAATSGLQRARSIANQEETALAPALEAQLQELQVTLDSDENDRRFAVLVDDVRLRQSEVDVARNRLKTQIAFPEIKNAFKTHYGIDVLTTAAVAAASRLHQCPGPIQDHLLAGLYLCWGFAPEVETAARLEQILETADLDPWRRQVRRALTARQWGELEGLLNQAPERQPRVFLLLLAGWLPREAGQIRVELFRRIQQSDPSDFWANLHFGGALTDSTPPEWDEALRYFTAALALRPRNPAVYLHLGHAMRHKGDRKGAIANTRQAIAISPNYAAAHYNLGVDLQQLEDLDGAIAAYRNAVALDAECVWALTNLGVALMDRQDLDGAMAVFRQAIAAEPQAVGPHVNLGRALLRRSQVDEALTELQEATRLQPDLFECHANLGNVYFGKGMTNEAIASYRKAAEIQPKNAAIFHNLGLAYAKAGSFEEDIDSQRKALSLKPDYAAARRELAVSLNNTAWRLAFRRDVPVADAGRAVELAKEAVSLFTNDGFFWNTLGVVHYRAGSWQDAIAALTTALDSEEGGGGHGWFFLAMAHWKLGAKEEARKWYDRAAQWMDKNKLDNEDLLRFRLEAEELMSK